MWCKTRCHSCKQNIVASKPSLHHFIPTRASDEQLSLLLSVPSSEAGKLHAHDPSLIIVTARYTQQDRIDRDAGPCWVSLGDPLDFLVGGASRLRVGGHAPAPHQTRPPGQPDGVGAAVDIDTTPVVDVDVLDELTVTAGAAVRKV